jgi:hypothetical protein
MKINLVSCLFVIDSEKNTNIRKNDIKTIKVLVDKNNKLPQTICKSGGMKDQVKENVSSLIGSNIFHIEQVFTMDYADSIDVIYMCATNIENVSLKDGYKLVDFKINDNKEIVFDDNKYDYKTIEKEENKNIEYIHEILVKDDELKRVLMNLLICYKRIRSNIDSTDIIFKFMGEKFTLEDVRMVYELIKDCTVDKSNFRKKIIKYCELTESKDETKNGFRPSQRYKFKPLKGYAWV